MPNDPRLNIQKAIDEGSEHTTLDNLANRGIRNVKVLDERAILELIGNAVDQVITSQTDEERARMVADSRRELDRLLKERNDFMSRANLLEAGKNELVQQIEKLQNELRVRRDVEAEQKDMLDREAATQEKIQGLLSENAFLRDEHDKMVEELDRLQTENAQLKEEIERLKALLAETQAEAESVKEQIAREQAEGEIELNRAQEEIQRLNQEMDTLRAGAAQAGDVEEMKAENARTTEALDDALREVESLRAELETAKAKPAPPPPPKAPPEEPIILLPEDKIEEVDPLPLPPPPKAEPEPVQLGHAAPVVRGPVDLSKIKKGKGLDIGTVNLVAAEQNENGEVELRLKRNAFIDVEITAYTKSMLTRLNVPYFVQGQKMYVLGEHAFELANVLNRHTRRPMADGLISPKEQDALPIMKLLIGSILGEPRMQGETCFYSVPGDPVDSDLSVAYHRDLFDAVLKMLGYSPKHIIEGHAVTFAELADEDFTGIGISCGGGMFNVCVAYKSMPALFFSTSRSGDWIDNNVAQALGIKPAKAALIKEKGVDLLNPKNREEDAISIYYQNLIKYNLTSIAERFRSAENMPSFAEPISIVFSGGTSMAGNFIELVRKVFQELDFPIPVKELRMAKDPLNATAKGALTAAMVEMAQAEGQ